MTSTLLFDRYVLKSLVPATIFVAITLAAIIFLTQSLKFLELIIDSGASSASFWVLTFLALPRFFEVILPISLMIAVLFVYNRMASDSEIVVMRAAGKSPMQLARPALIFSLIVTFSLLFVTTWLAPVSLSNMIKMKLVIKAQYSILLFREGIFNTVGDDLMVYIHKRNKEGELEGLVIHDSRDDQPAPVTIVAKRGVIVATDEGRQVLVYDGSRQDFNKKTKALNRLDFERYVIDLPESGAVRKRNKDANERTLFELMRPDLNKEFDRDNVAEFKAEIHRRILGPLLAVTFTMVALCFLLLGPVNRRGQAKRIFLATAGVIVLQSLFLAFFNIAIESFIGLILLYFITLMPILISIFLLSTFGEKFRHSYFFRKEKINLSEGKLTS